MSRFPKITSQMHNRLNALSCTRDSIEQYHATVRQFGKWVAEKEGTERVSPSRAHELVQTYINERARDRSTHTVAKDLAGLSQALGETKRDFVAPRRDAPIRGRALITSHHTATNDRIYRIASAIGIREREYGQLRGRDIKVENGYTFVHVSKGKGGKEQWQLVSPGRAREVQALFENKKPDEFVFTREEVKGCEHANLHAMRREHAQEMYQWYLNRTPAEKAEWREKVHERFLANPNKAERNAYEKAMSKGPEIHLRGARAEQFRHEGLPTTYDREAVMFVSVMCLAHYREDVTISNYFR